MGFARLPNRPLNLHLLEAVLPDNNVWGDAILAVVEEDNPGYGQSSILFDLDKLGQTHIPSGFIDSPV